MDSFFLQFLQHISLLTNSGFGVEMYIIFAWYYHLSIKDVHPVLSNSPNSHTAWKQ